LPDILSIFARGVKFNRAACDVNREPR
jgi:hypothetical protein